MDSVPSVISSSPAIMRRSVDFPAAGGADEDHELALVHREVDALHDLHGAVAFRTPLS
jgi:hypothetical protein